MLAIQPLPRSRFDSAVSRESDTAVEPVSQVEPVLDAVVIPETLVSSPTVSEYSPKRARILPCLLAAAAVLALALVVHGAVVYAMGMRGVLLIQWLDRVSMWIAGPVAVGIAAGFHLMRTGKHRLGGLFLAAGLVVAASPSFIVLYIKQRTSLTTEDSQRLLVVEEAGQRVARHPHLRFSFPLARGLRENPETAKRIAELNPIAMRIYTFTREEAREGNPEAAQGRAMVMCMVTPPLWRDPERLDRYAESFMAGANAYAPIVQMGRRGDGLHTDVWYIQDIHGAFSYGRLLAVDAEDGQLHFVALSCMGLDDNDTRLTIEGLVLRTRDE